MGLFDKTTAQTMFAAANVGRFESSDCTIQFIIGVNGEVFHNITAPVEYAYTQKIEEGVELMMVNIKVHQSACKSLTLDEETLDLVYDVGVNGKPFCGNIPTGLIAAIVCKTGHSDDYMSLPIPLVYPAYLAAKLNSESRLERERVEGSAQPTPLKTVTPHTLKLASEAESAAGEQDLPRPTTRFVPRLVQ